MIAPIEETDDDEARAIFDVNFNFFGALNVMRAVLPIMRAQGEGTIVKVSSIGAQVSPSYYGIYAASKRALESVSAALQAETAGFGIRLIVVEPGNFQTLGIEATEAPGVIANAVLEAVDDPERRFLYTVGADAEAVFAAAHTAPPDGLALDTVLEQLAGDRPGSDQPDSTRDLP